MSSRFLGRLVQPVQTLFQLSGAGELQMSVSGKSLVVVTLTSLSLGLQGCATTGGSGEKRMSTAMENAIAGCIGGVAIGAIGGALVGAALGGNRGLEQGAIAGTALGVGRCIVLIELAAAEDKAKLREAEFAAISNGKSATSTIKTKNGKTATVRTTVSAAPLPAPQKVRVKRPAPVESSAAAPVVAANAAAAPAPAGTVANAAASAGPVKAGAAITQPTTIASDADGTIRVDSAIASAPAAVATEKPQVQVMSFVEEKQNYATCRFSEMVIDIDGQSADGGKQKWCKSVDGSWEPVAG